MLYLKYVQSLSEISWNWNFLFDTRVSFEGTMSIKVRLIKNIRVKPAPNSEYAFISKVRLTTREHGN